MYRLKFLSFGSIKKTGSENFLFFPSALSKRFSLHLRTFSKIPAEGGIGDSCLRVHSSQDLSKGEKRFSSQISAV